MKIYKIIEFAFTDYPYQERGIEIINIDKFVVDGDDYREFLEKYKTLGRLSFSYNGENIHRFDENEWSNIGAEYFFEDGMYKDTVTKQYYMITVLDVKFSI
jgi:hypothetical protein